MTDSGGTPIRGCRRCLAYILSVTDSRDLTEIQEILVRIIHRSH